MSMTPIVIGNYKCAMIDKAKYGCQGDKQGSNIKQIRYILSQLS